MNKDLIETPRFIRSLGDEVLLKGRLVAFDIDKNNRVENVVRLEYGQTINVPNYSIYTKNNIIYEPEKVKVQQFVADWYEGNKDDFEFNVWDWIAFRNEPEKLENKEFSYWLNDGEGNPIQTLVNMHQFGYEVDEEKRYLVKIKASNQYIMSNPDENAVFFYSSRSYSKLTRKELEEAGFGWVFDCEGVEIEEVEE